MTSSELKSSEVLLEELESEDLSAFSGSGSVAGMAGTIFRSEAFSGYGLIGSGRLFSEMMAGFFSGAVCFFRIDIRALRSGDDLWVLENDRFCVAR